MSSSVRALMSALEKLEINDEDCVTKILISGKHYPRLQSIKLHRMEKLEKMDLRMVKTSNCLEVTNCAELKKLLGISDLPELVELKISYCPKLKIESLRLRHMKCLQRMSFDITVAVKYFELDSCQNLKTAMFCCEEIVELRIRGCPELKKMPDIIGSSCLERLIIDGCGIQELRLHYCRNLKSVSLANTQFTMVDIYHCPELKQMPDITGSSCLERLIIQELRLHHCRNLKSASLANTQFTVVDIYHCPELPSLARLSSSGTAEFHRLQWMKLRYYSGTLLQNFIRSLKNVPPGGLDMIGRAVDGAKSRLNENLFYEATMGVEGVTEIGTDQYYSKCSELTAIIVCFVLVVDSLTSVEELKDSLVDYSGLGLCQGELIITMVTCPDKRYSYYLSVSIEDFLKRGVLKKGFRVEMRKGEGWKCMDLLSVIVDKLYY